MKPTILILLLMLPIVNATTGVIAFELEKNYDYDLVVKPNVYNRIKVLDEFIVFKLTNVSDGKAEIQLGETYETISVGNETILDLNNDSRYDIIIDFKEIRGTMSILKLRKVDLPITKPELIVEVNETVETELVVDDEIGKGKLIMLAILGFLVVIALSLSGYLIYIAFRKKED